MICIRRDADFTLNLYVVTNLPLPAAALPPTPDPWGTDPNEAPF